MVQAVHDAFVAHGAPNIEAIARGHYDLVFRFCARRVGQDLAQDAAQDTFLTAQKALKRFRGDSTIQTWLLGIAHNECRRLSRKKRIEPTSLDFHNDGGPSPEGAWIDRHALREALLTLSQDHRDAVFLVELDGLTYDEAATVIGVPAGTVKSRLHYAFQHLRRALASEGEAA